MGTKETRFFRRDKKMEFDAAPTDDTLGLVWILSSLLAWDKGSVDAWMRPYQEKDERMIKQCSIYGI